MPQIHRVSMKEIEHIKEQARIIRDVAQEVLDACHIGKPIDPYAYSKIMSGHLAGEAACLAVMILQYEMEAKR